jgi:hypothetical protein
MAVGIMEFRDEKVVRERIYFGDPWEPPAWHAPWIERFDPWEPDSPVQGAPRRERPVRLSRRRIVVWKPLRLFRAGP